jgi:hypothetical protein
MWGSGDQVARVPAWPKVSEPFLMVTSMLSLPCPQTDLAKRVIRPWAEQPDTEWLKLLMPSLALRVK